METTQLLGRKVKDTKNEYSGDIGTVTDIRHFEKANKTYAVVQWDDGTKHGNVYRNYSPDKFGFMKRIKLVD